MGHQKTSMSYKKTSVLHKNTPAYHQKKICNLSFKSPKELETSISNSYYSKLLKEF